jgi:hypothetical protein
MKRQATPPIGEKVAKKARVTTLEDSPQTAKWWHAQHCELATPYLGPNLAKIVADFAIYLVRI